MNTLEETMVPSRFDTGAEAARTIAKRGRQHNLRSSTTLQPKNALEIVRKVWRRSPLTAHPTWNR